VGTLRVLTRGLGAWVGSGAWVEARTGFSLGSGDWIFRLREGIELKSLILAQIERWRHALHMQVERVRGATSALVANG
jgi:hypothetical protein